MRLQNYREDFFILNTLIMVTLIFVFAMLAKLGLNDQCSELGMQLKRENLAT
jgi:hypothetical protein